MLNFKYIVKINKNLVVLLCRRDYFDEDWENVLIKYKIYLIYL